ncbi:MAG: cytochrome C [bacterium]
MKVTIVAVLVGVSFSVLGAFAEDHEDRKTSQVSSNSVYKAVCGECHLAYPPRLLPAVSWLEIVDKPGKHAGGALDLKDNAKAEIKKYLAEKSADRKPSKKHSKATVTPDAGAGPIRISELPRIREKHREIAQAVFARKSIGSRGNCIACHKTAESGDFDEDNVSIPAK